MDSYSIPFAVRDALLCLVFLAGMLGGFQVRNRGREKPGTRIVIGFLLLAIDPAAEFIMFNLILPFFGVPVDYLVFSWSYVCIGSLTTITGFVVLMSVLRSALWPERKAAEASNEDVIHFVNQ